MIYATALSYRIILFLLHQLKYDCFFFFNDTATTEIYTLSLHDALPIYHGIEPWSRQSAFVHERDEAVLELAPGDRKSTRLNSSHGYISYAVFCLKKKKNK